MRSEGGVKRWVLAEAGMLLSVYFGVMGIYVARVPALDSSGCPPSSPCDPLRVTPHRGQGFALIGLGAVVLLLTVGILFATRSARPQSESLAKRRPGASRGRLVLTMLVYATSVLALALGGTAVALIVRSPVQCLGGSSPPPGCPPTGLPPLLLATVGAVVVAFTLGLAGRSLRRGAVGLPVGEGVPDGAT
jgi:hypothetical protein